MADTFYPFVENGAGQSRDEGQSLEVRHPARIAIFDDAAAAPRVVVVEPSDIRTYLEEITKTVTSLAKEQGGRIPFTVIREVVENLIHAYFIEPTVSILDKGNTIRFSDQGPGISDKSRALEYGTTSATAEMKRYIRGVGSGLPYAQQWLEDKGGSLTVEDNIHNGTVVTISLAHGPSSPDDHANSDQQAFYLQQQQMAMPGAQGAWTPSQQASQTGYPSQQPWPPLQQPFQPQGWQQGYQQPVYPPSMYQLQGWPQQMQPSYQAAAMPAPVVLNEREGMALDYLRTHESVGPRDLNAVKALSESTWSRVLSGLEDKGLIAKRGGQKRFLTEAGRAALGML